MGSLGMFGFLQDLNNYDERMVGRYPAEGDFLVDTARVSDGRQPYETAVKHPEYNGGRMVIVEAYPTRSDAKEGHRKWVGIMTAPDLPAELTDCQNSEISQWCDLQPFPRITKECKKG